MATAKQKAMVAAMLSEYTPMAPGDAASICFTPFRGDVFGSTKTVNSFYDMDYTDYPIKAYDPKTGMYTIRDDDGMDCKVPFYCVKLSKKNDGRTYVVGSEEARINTTGTSVDVGCQNIKFDEVKLVYEAMVKLQATSKAKKAVAKKAPAKKKAR
jgi:hypothetical protein